MTYEEFQRHIGKAGLKMNEFALLLGMHPKSISNLRQRPEVPQYLAALAVLMGEVAERGIDVRELLAQHEIGPKKSRGTGLGRFGGDKSDQE
jgi:hypothetical protein